MKVENPRNTASGVAHHVSRRSVCPNPRTTVVACACDIGPSPRVPRVNAGVRLVECRYHTGRRAAGATERTTAAWPRSMDGVSYLTHRVDGELGCWTAVEWRPVHLRDAVERFWHFTGRTAHPRERVLPTGLLQLVVHLDARYGVVREGGVERCPALVLSGQQTRPVVIEAPSCPSTVLGIELTPAGAWRLLRRPLHELGGQDVDLCDLVGAEAARLADRCHATASDARACLSAAAAWIETRLGRAPAVDPPIAWIADRIRRRRGNVVIGAL